MREAERVLAAEAMQELRRLATTMTEFAARLSGQIVNNVLQVNTSIFDADGVVEASWGAAAGAVSVTNLDDTVTITVTSGPRSAGPPTAGTGVHKVPPRSTCTIPLASHQMTIYGTAGDEVSFVAYACAALPVSG